MGCMYLRYVRQCCYRKTVLASASVKFPYYDNTWFNERTSAESLIFSKSSVINWLESAWFESKWFEWFELVLMWLESMWFNVIQNYIIFLLNFFNFKTILMLNIFENAVVSRDLFHFHLFLRHVKTRSCQRNSTSLCQWGWSSQFSCWDSVTAIPTNIDITPDSRTTLQNINLWRYSHDGSIWVHRNSVICVPPEINTYFFTTFSTPKVEVPITVSPYINGGAWLVSVNGSVIQTRSTYCEIFRPYSYIRQQDMFHPSAVCVYYFIRCQFWHSEFSEYFIPDRDHTSYYWKVQIYTSLGHSLLMAMTNDTWVKSSVAPQTYKFVSNHAHEISGCKCLSRIPHYCAPHLGVMNGDVQSDLATMVFNNREACSA